VVEVADVVAQKHGTTTASVLEVAFSRDFSHLDTDKDKKIVTLF
jgi:hypothetical protein